MDGEKQTEEKENEPLRGESESTSQPSKTTPVKKQKINVVLKPVGDAPILKQKLWSVDPDKTVASITQFVSRYLKLEAENSVFLFVNQAFAPSPDQLIRNLYECFGSDGKLVLHYSRGVAWG